MIKTKLALGALLTAFVLAPAAADAAAKKSHAKAHKHGKAAAKAASPGAARPAAGRKAAAAGAVRAIGTSAAEGRQDRGFDTLTGQFLNALWRIDPDTAVSVGKYDTAATLNIPDAAFRAQELAFIDEWLGKFGAIDTRRLSPKQRADLAILLNKLNADRWYLSTFREFEWNPSLYNVAAPIDLILTTDYASEPQRLRTLLKRIAGVPAYYQAAQASIVNPTREHVQLAIAQAPGVLTVLDQLGQKAQASILNPEEKQLYGERIAASRAAVQGYVAWLSDLDQTLQKTGARSFRIGKELYEQKFAFDIQSASTAEQTYQKALAAREQLLAKMSDLSDELWAKTMGDAPKPAERNDKIGMVIDKLSANHVAPADFVPEIKREIPVLQEWVSSHKLLTLDPDKPLEVRQTPAYQSGVAGASINAPGPYRPQDRTYYNVTPLDNLTPEQAENTLREYNHWILQILNIHEAIPGHYAQLIYANRSPSIVKSLFGNGAMVEGWAVYGERMMLESGYGDNAPEMWLMYSKWNLRSVTNTILDYGVHVLGMTKEEAMDLLTKQAFQTSSEAEEKWHRVQLSSVQLTSYFSGYSEIMELREQRKQALGARFNLKQFHDQFLSYGSAPVRVIKELMQ
ncbi:MAG TPA: DUF885 domain-containing protein [Janthinobacterium sp.]|jgi:uncharacterized protein (DUF885 family)|nr:DUF885 domain-containing protein [Janthinobacterium sp.]